MQIQQSILGIGLFLLACNSYANEVHMPENPEDVILQKISDRIYVLHGLHELPNQQNKGLISNSGVILTKSGVVIVDSGGGLEVGRRILNDRFWPILLKNSRFFNWAKPFAF